MLWQKSSGRAEHCVRPIETRYARSGDVRIAYQVVGQGAFDLVFVPGSNGFIDAAGLFGANAGYEAAARAGRSLDQGNHIHFCHWRQIERLILLLAIDQPAGTVH